MWTLENELKSMYDEMLENTLEVVTIPARNPMYCNHKVRAVLNSNPDWYRKLCREFPSRCKAHRNRKNKFDTRIKRQQVLSFLLNPTNNYKYKDAILEIAKNRLDNYEQVPF